MKSHFELCMQPDGRYFFVARKVDGDVLAESPRYGSRRAALEGMAELLGLCGADTVACYDRARRSWRSARE